MTSRLDSGRLLSRPDMSFEEALWRQGYSLVAGIDEAGRGALAGPLAAAVLVFPMSTDLLQVLRGVRDSKQMSAAEREYWAPRVKELALAWGVGFATVDEIDRLGVVSATRLAMQRALEHLGLRPHHLLIDYLTLPEVAIPQTALVKGDRRALSIAAASVLAKTTRDAQMCRLDLRYPGYGLALHKGYATPAHLAALARLGPSPIHRRSFAPVRSVFASSR